MDNVLGRDNTCLHSRLSIEISAVSACLAIHNRSYMLGFKPEAFAVDGLNLLGECLDHLLGIYIHILTRRHHRVMNHQDCIITHKRAFACSPDNRSHRCCHALDDTLGIYLRVGDGRVCRHTVEHAATFRINKYAYARGTNDILQEVKLIVETRCILLGNATEESNRSGGICLNLANYILKCIDIHWTLFWIRVVVLK